MAHKKKNELIELVGWGGAAATLAAYFLVSFGMLGPKDLNYQLFNFFGALGLGAVCFVKKTYQPFFVNIIWGVVALLAITNIVLSFSK